MDLVGVEAADFWRCGLCGVSVLMGTSHECEQGAFMPPSAADRIAVALERIAAVLEGD
jgi:hypothetical protein